MGLDDIQLTGFLREAFFKNSLVVLAEAIPKSISKQDNQIRFLGENKKRIIFLVNDSQNKYLDDVQMTFLSDLLSACQLTMADIALVNFSHNNDKNYHLFNEQLGAKKILMFGLTPQQLDLPFAIPCFQMQNFNEQVYLVCPSLLEIRQDQTLKKQLWENLQKIFTIKKKK
jgi:hypothetical protein